MTTASTSSAIVFLILAPLLGASAAQEPAGESSPGGSATHWLVTRDGQRIETRGPWEVQGRRVLYTDTRGVLASLRLSSVDLEASELASRPRVAVAEPVPNPASQEPALVLSNKDVAAWNGEMTRTNLSDNGEESAVSTPEAASSPAAAGESQPASAAAATQGTAVPEPPSGRESRTDASSATSTESPRLSVVSYRDLGDYDQGIQLFGTVRNESKDEARNVKVTVRVLDEAGNQLDQKAAQIRNRQLAAGETMTFRVGFPDLRAYGSVEFDLSANR